MQKLLIAWQLFLVNASLLRKISPKRLPSVLRELGLVSGKLEDKSHYGSKNNISYKLAMRLSGDDEMLQSQRISRRAGTALPGFLKSTQRIVAPKPLQTPAFPTTGHRMTMLVGFGEWRVGVGWILDVRC